MGFYPLLLSLGGCFWGFFFHSSLIVMFHYQGKVSQMLFHRKDEGRKKNKTKDSGTPRYFRSRLGPTCAGLTLMRVCREVHSMSCTDSAGRREIARAASTQRARQSSGQSARHSAPGSPPPPSSVCKPSRPKPASAPPGAGAADKVAPVNQVNRLVMKCGVEIPPRLSSSSSRGG